MLNIDWFPEGNGLGARVALDDETEADILLEPIDFPGPVKITIDLFTVTVSMPRLVAFVDSRGLKAEYVGAGHEEHTNRGECILHRDIQSCMRDAKIASERWLLKFQETRYGES